MFVNITFKLNSFTIIHLHTGKFLYYSPCPVRLLPPRIHTTSSCNSQRVRTGYLIHPCSSQLGSTRWCPSSLAKLVYDSNNLGLWQIYLYLMRVINQLITGGAPPCRFSPYKWTLPLWGYKGRFIGYLVWIHNQLYSRVGFWHVLPMIWYLDEFDHDQTSREFSHRGMR